MASTLLIFTWILLNLLTSDARFCYKCLSLDCPGDDNVLCEDVRAFVMAQLRAYYNFEYLPPCPDDDSGSEWLETWLYSTPCKRTRMPYEVCTAGKIRVRSSIGNYTITSHASVLGCANEKLVTSIKTTIMENKSHCDVSPNLQGSKSDAGISRTMVLKHCNEPGAICHDADFCVDVKHGAINIWSEENDLIVPARDYGMMIGIISGVSILLIVLLGISLYALAHFKKKRSKFVMIYNDCSGPIGYQW
ncbi:hypothetical protein Fcan01_01709 [Folsomia candida]|uniref:Uncharacterized protein n=1 Tax=Folsomia candida TaxID=158441 RepID=A0A226EZL9_FOLCA|nr:hypothetical protein Fcan01_01709 [Folsomia candida]